MAVTDLPEATDVARDPAGDLSVEMRRRFPYEAPIAVEPEVGGVGGHCVQAGW